MRFLIDNDVFLAALYAGHEGHKTARRWLDAHKKQGWGIAAETHLAAQRLLMNPVVMGPHPLTAVEALEAISAELAGAHPGRIVLAPKQPDPAWLGQAQGHRQVMDLWLLQIARDTRSRLATLDQGMLARWPKLAVGID